MLIYLALDYIGFRRMHQVGGNDEPFDSYHWNYASNTE